MGRGTRQETCLTAGEGSEGESEQGVLLSQELRGTSVEGGSGSGKADGSTRLVNGEALRELAGHEEEEGQVEEEEEGDQGDVDSQGCQEEEEGDDKPGTQEDPDSARKLARDFLIGGRNTETGVKEGGVGQPETTVAGESSSAERIASGKLPHSGNELSETTNETGHADDGVGDGDTASLHVVHGEHESGGSEGVETKRTGVAKDPQLRGGIVDIGMGGESAVGSATAGVVREGTLLVGDGIHGGGSGGGG